MQYMDLIDFGVGKLKPGSDSLLWKFCVTNDKVIGRNFDIRAREWRGNSKFSGGLCA